MNKIITIFVAGVGSTIVVNLSATDSTKPFPGERDTVVMTRYFYDMWKVNTILMDYKDTWNTYIGGNKFFDQATNIAS